MSALTYAEVGATRHGRLPAGYAHLRHRTRLGHGEAAFRTAAELLMDWRMHRRIPVAVAASTPRAEVGTQVRITLAGVVRGSCRVVWVVDDPERRGWAYGTLPGHPECGEEAFLVSCDAGGDVWLDVTAFSRPGGRLARVLGPLVPLFQRAYARRCGQVLRAAVRRDRRARPR
ncbi:DUF1990 domain-containing protein [Streptacidiphilus rugosus]|uniref:DUF1990 domain-containing protein n=1 Tax=Streptacidiphilus rugosus TaxID=405783 RepID=UPI000AD4618A|nr:DUF1990 domain-containing protein [Streptacidiphilus rugosus]